MEYFFAFKAIYLWDIERQAKLVSLDRVSRAGISQQQIAHETIEERRLSPRAPADNFNTRPDVTPAYVAEGYRKDGKPLFSFLKIFLHLRIIPQLQHTAFDSVMKLR